MILGNFCDCIAIKPFQLRQICAGRNIACCLRKWPAQPLGNRRHKAHFWAIQNILGQISLHAVLHQIFALPAPHPHIFGQAGGKFHQAVVEQRLPRLKPHGHAGAVKFGQYVAGQPHFHIGILGLIEARARRCRPHQGVHMRFAAIIAKRTARPR